MIVQPTFVQILTTSNPEIAGLGTQAYFIDANGGVGVDRSSGIGRFGWGWDVGWDVKCPLRISEKCVVFSQALRNLTYEIKQ